MPAEKAGSRPAPPHGRPARPAARSPPCGPRRPPSPRTDRTDRGSRRVRPAASQPARPPRWSRHRRSGRRSRCRRASPPALHRPPRGCLERPAHARTFPLYTRRAFSQSRDRHSRPLSRRSRSPHSDSGLPASAGRGGEHVSFALGERADAVGDRRGGEAGVDDPPPRMHVANRVRQLPGRRVLEEKPGGAALDGTAEIAGTAEPGPPCRVPP